MLPECQLYVFDVSGGVRVGAGGGVVVRCLRSVDIETGFLFQLD